MTVFAQDLALVTPFVQVAAFKAHPTYLDLSNLRSGSSVQADQDAELFNILLIASASVENECNQPIQAHVQTDNRRLYVDRRGRLHLYPDHAPVRTVLSYSYQTSPGTTATSIANPTCWIEDGRQITVDLAGSAMSWSGALQLGGPSPSQELFTSTTYVAGYANATMSSCIQGATSITVSNPTGIFAGDTLRIWEPGKEESVVVGAGWAGQNTVPFTPAAIPISATQFAHAAGTGVTGFAADLTLATTYFAIDGLQRWGTSSANWPGARVKSATGKNMDNMTPWERKACRLLEPYGRTR